MFKTWDKQQEILFDVVDGRNAKRQGLALAVEHRKELLQRVRAKLVELASSRPSRNATADDAQAILVSWGYNSFDLGNAAGAIFRGWHFTGMWVESARVTNHGRMIRVWRLE